MKTLDEAWRGIMLTYTERDFPGGEPYKRTVPGWECVACGTKYGTSLAPPRKCVCGAEWDGVTP